MSEYRLSRRAVRDIFVIWNRVAQDSVETADTVEAAIYANCELIASSTGIGHTRSDLTHRPVLVWPALPYRNYQIVYRRETDPVEIVRVLHAARRRPWKHDV